MTVDVADSSPLNYLIIIGFVDVLPRLFGTVVVPQQVISELIDPAAPSDVRGWVIAEAKPDRALREGALLACASRRTFSNADLSLDLNGVD
jgi:predicted nucleic acid-binding protein